MKAFVPFALVPVLALAAWSVADWLPPPDVPALPSVTTLDAPPALGVVMPDAPQDPQAVRVPMTALLPDPPAVVVSATNQRHTAPVTELKWPQVKAILVHDQRRAAWVNGQALAVGDQLGDVRVTAIDPARVQFEHVRLPLKQWVDVQQP